MSRVIFSLGSEHMAQLARRELERNGLREPYVRILDRAAHRRIATIAPDARLAFAAMHGEMAAGRVLLEVEVDAQNQAAVERLIDMLGGDARKLATPAPAALDDLANLPASNDFTDATPAV